jgi:twitching motility protein PilT
VTPSAQLNFLLQAVIDTEARGLLLVPDQVPRLRTLTELRPHGEALSADDLESMARALFSPRHLQLVAERGTTSYVLRLGEEHVARLTLASTRGRYSLTVGMRVGRLPTLERCNVPPVTKDLLASSHGLVAVAGPHGSGKTTTLYALVEWLNQERSVHICTVEDPMEYELGTGKALLQQREVGTDVPDMASGISAAVEQDRDVLMVNGLPDLDVLTAALHAAETGHLVLFQVHASDAWDALERMIEAAPPGMQGLVRRALAESLRGVVYQRLLPKVGQGRTAVCGVLVPDEALCAALAAGQPVRGLQGSERSVKLKDEIDRLLAAGTIDEATAEGARRGLE